jgi:hypothetical protein
MKDSATGRRHHGRGRLGRALARPRRGAHLAPSDIDEAGLAETVALCEGHGVKVTSPASTS